MRPFATRSLATRPGVANAPMQHATSGCCHALPWQTPGCCHAHFLRAQVLPRSLDTRQSIATLTCHKPGCCHAPLSHAKVLPPSLPTRPGVATLACHTAIYWVGSLVSQELTLNFCIRESVVVNVVNLCKSQNR